MRCMRLCAPAGLLGQVVADDADSLAHQQHIITTIPSRSKLNGFALPAMGRSTAMDEVWVIEFKRIDQ